MKADLFLWRPVLARIATLEEIERSWSLVDLLDAHEVLDLKDHYTAEANKPLKGKK